MTFYEAFNNHCEELYQKLPSKIKLLIPLDKFKENILRDMEVKNIDLIFRFKKLTPELTSAIDSEINKKIGVLCLTEDKNNIRMWGVYADSHKGFVLEFCADNSFFNSRKTNQDEFRFLRKIDYVEDRPSLNIFGADGVKYFLTKSKDWSYEKEWRMLMPLNDASQTLILDGELIHLFDIPPDAIKAVYLGCKMHDSNKDKILQLIKSNKCLGHVLVYQSILDQKSFALNFEKIS